MGPPASLLSFWRPVGGPPNSERRSDGLTEPSPVLLFRGASSPRPPSNRSRSRVAPASGAARPASFAPGSRGVRSLGAAFGPAEPDSTPRSAAAPLGTLRTLRGGSIGDCGGAGGSLPARRPPKLGASVLPAGEGFGDVAPGTTPRPNPGARRPSDGLPSVTVRSPRASPGVGVGPPLRPPSNRSRRRNAFASPAEGVEFASDADRTREGSTTGDGVRPSIPARGPR